MNHIDVKYAGLISPRLERWVIKSHTPYKANFRCPICGDSNKKKSKTRGWILENKNNHGSFYCHNCGASMSLGNFIKTLDPGLYTEYVIDKKLDSIATEKPKELYEKPLEQIKDRVPKFKKSGSPLLAIKKISQLDNNHPAKQYVLKREIPTNAHHRLYYTPKFKSWVNSIIPDKFDDKMKDEPRLIIPFIDQRGNLFGFQGRSFRKDDPLRYITIMIDENKPKIFGLDQVEFERPYFIFEGPLDSLFIKNSIAMAGSDGSFDSLQNLSNAVLVFDNEPRNKEIIAKMEKYILQGMKICIWDNSIKSKDINDIVLNEKLTPHEIQMIIENRTFKGMLGQLELAAWRKA